MTDEYSERDKQRGVSNDFFSETDCDLNGRDAMYVKAISLEKANRLLRKRGRVVYGKPEHCRDWFTPLTENNIPIGSSHTALLINVQENRARAILAREK